MKLIIAGSREIIHMQVLLCALDRYNLDKEVVEQVVCGMARGPDKLGRQWAIDNGIDVAEFPADWKRLNKAAGPIRNQQMGEYADRALILWDGNSRGSKHMADTMKRFKKPCDVFKVDIEYFYDERDNWICYALPTGQQFTFKIQPGD